MSKPKGTDHVEFARLEDALVNSILAASETELREEIAAAGEDADDIIRCIDALFATAKASRAFARLRTAQEELRIFRANAREITAEERESAGVRFEIVRSHDCTLSKKLLLTARNGQDATERDIKSLIDDFAELERLDEAAEKNDCNSS